MTNILRYALRNISPETISDLQEKYPNASVSIQLNDAPDAGGLSVQGFWELMALLDWTKTGDDAAVIEPLVAALADRPMRHIYDFKDILSQKLYALDGEKYARSVGYMQAETFSPDSFLFSRCAVVANGEQTYLDVLSHPEKMPADVEFAPLLRIANEAYKRQKGNLMKYVAAWPVETFSNPAFLFAIFLAISHLG